MFALQKALPLFLHLCRGASYARLRKHFQVVSLSSKWMEWCLHGRQQYNRNKVQALDNIKEQQEAIDKRNEELRKQFEAYGSLRNN